MDTQSKAEAIRWELKRRRTKSSQLLAMFRKFTELDTNDLQLFGTGVSSRLYELRQDGHRIVSHQIRNGYWQYIYLGDDEDEE